MSRTGLAAALASVLMFAACAESDRPDPEASEPPSAGVVVRPVDGVPRPLAKLLADSVVSALSGEGVGARVSDDGTGRFRRRHRRRQHRHEDGL